MESQSGKAEGKKELSAHHWMQTNKQTNIVILLTEYLQTKGLSLWAFLKHSYKKRTWTFGML